MNEIEKKAMSETELLRQIYLKLAGDSPALDTSKALSKASLLRGLAALSLKYEPLVSLEHSELLALINANTLIPGMLYRITDYVTTTAQADTVSAGNQFDLVVKALSANELSEDAKAVLHDGDTYFTGLANLGAWDIKYTPFNDTVKFAWADEVNGKGVIYFMRDEWGNECPYDFKNIQFLRSSGGNLFKTGHYYTFTGEGTSQAVHDFSIFGNSVWENQNWGEITPSCFNNKMQQNAREKFELNNNVFVCTDGASYFEKEVFNNSFGSNCYGNTFGYGCTNNSFGSNCYNNTFGYTCTNNSFGSYCYNNTFGYNCPNNSFKSNYSGNTFGNSCANNSFGAYCINNSFGNDFAYNSFRGSCANNSFGANCKNNTFLRTTTNFTSVTELYAKTYPHEVIGVGGNKALVRWYNSAGELQTLLVD